MKKNSSPSNETRASQRETPTRVVGNNSGAGATKTKPRIRPAMLITGTAVIAVAGLGAGALASFTQPIDSEVLITTTTIAAGKEIKATALTKTRMQVPVGVTAFAASDLPAVTKMLASAQLTPGTVLTSDNVARERLVPQGKTVVGIPLESGRLPGVPLVAGAPVRLVEVPDKTNFTTVTATRSFKAVVYSVDLPSDKAMVATTMVNVIVAQADANELAGLAASGRLALVIDSIATN